MNSFFESLKFNTTLSQIDLSCNHICQIDISLFIENIKNLKNLMKLNLNGISIFIIFLLFSFRYKFE